MPRLVCAALLVAACGGPSAAPPPVDVTGITIAPPTASAPPAVVLRPSQAGPGAHVTAADNESLPDAFRRDLLGRVSAITDAALPTFQSASSAESSQRLDDARKGYFTLIQQYPQSPLVPYAYLAFADMFTAEAVDDATKLELARQAYQKVVTYPPPGNLAFAYAWERLAVVDARAAEFPKSLADARRAIDATAKWPTSPLAERVVSSARTTLVASFASSGDAAKAPQFFRSTDAANASALVVALGEVYVGRNQARDLADLYDAALVTSDAVVCAGAARVGATFHPEGPVGIVAVTKIEAKRRTVCVTP